jgi:hypothetical protein
VRSRYARPRRTGSDLEVASLVGELGHFAGELDQPLDLDRLLRLDHRGHWLGFCSPERRSMAALRFPLDREPIPDLLKVGAVGTENLARGVPVDASSRPSRSEVPQRLQQQLRFTGVRK